MASVEFLGPLSNKGKMSVDIKNLSDLKELLKDDEEIQKWLPLCSVAVNDTLVSDPDTAIKSSDSIVILPPVCGG